MKADNFTICKHLKRINKLSNKWLNFISHNYEAFFPNYIVSYYIYLLTKIRKIYNRNVHWCIRVLFDLIQLIEYLPTL